MIDSVTFTSEPRRQRCELQSVKMTDGFKIFPSQSKKNCQIRKLLTITQPLIGIPQNELDSIPGLDLCTWKPSAKFQTEIDY